MLSVKIHFGFRDTNRLKVNGWEKIVHADSNQKRTGVAIVVPEKNRLKS